jgi:hypothetical protein
VRFTKIVTDVVDEASGRSHRRDATLPGTGGPAGNAKLTAWTGLVLLVLVVVEVITVLDVRGMLSWHVAVGSVLVPVALLKTGSTGWRFVRYYAGYRQYREAGPPPTMLRILGPLVVLSTLGLLGTGLALIVLGPTSGRRPLATVFGQGLDVLTLHQALFIVFAVVTGLHLLARILPAVSLVLDRHQRTGAERPALPGARRRTTLLMVAVLAGIVTAVVFVGWETPWQHDQFQFDFRPGQH